MVLQLIARVFMIVSNFISLIGALSLLVIGGWMMFDIYSLLSFLPNLVLNPQQSQVIYDAGFTIVIASVISIVLCSFAIAGAWRKVRIILVLYLGAMSVILVALGISGFVSIARPDLVKLLAESSLNNEVALEVENGLLNYAHNRYGCCGIQDLPEGCDRDYPPTKQCFNGSIKCQFGCLTPVYENLMAPYTPIAAILLFGLAFIVMCGIIFTCCIYCTLKP